MTESSSMNDPVDILVDLLKRSQVKIDRAQFERVKEFLYSSSVRVGSDHIGSGDDSGRIRGAADPLVKKAKEVFDRGSRLIEVTHNAQMIALGREAILGFMNESDYVRMRNSGTKFMSKYEKAAFEFLKKTGGVPPGHGLIERRSAEIGKYFECTFCAESSRELPVPHLKDCPR